MASMVFNSTVFRLIIPVRELASGASPELPVGAVFCSGWQRIGDLHFLSNWRAMVLTSTTNGIPGIIWRFNGKHVTYSPFPVGT